MDSNPPAIRRDQAYGTVARLSLKPGGMDALQQMGQTTEPPAGAIVSYALQLDNAPNDLFLVTIFDSKESYRANAESAEQHERFTQMMQSLAHEPEWHDGHVAYHKEV